MSLDNANFVWKIPSLDTAQKQLLCDGYVRENYSKYIVKPIINLFAEYYNRESFTLDEVKNAPNPQIFVSSNIISPIFRFQDEFFYLELYPNGTNKYTKQYVLLYLCIVMIPKNIDSIFASFTLSLQETRTHSIKLKWTFDRKKWYKAWNINTLSLDTIKDLKKLTFTVNIHLLEIAKLNPDIGIKDKYFTKFKRISNIKRTEPVIIPTPATYKWMISDALIVNKIHTAEDSERFISPFMSYGPFKWYLKIIPKHYKIGAPWIGFSIWYFPPNIVECLCKMQIIFNELNIMKSTYITINADAIGGAIYGEMKLEDFKQLNQYSFVVDVSIIHILYDDVKDQDDGLQVKPYQNVFVPVAMHKLPNFEYEWRIINEKQLNDIKKAPNVFAFISPIFEACSLKWYISFSPNGSRISRKGTVNIFLNLVSFRSCSLRIPVKFEMEWVESGKIFTSHQTFRMDSCSDGATMWPLKTADIQTLTSFTVKLRVWIADIIENEEIITNKYLVNYKNDSSITKARNITVPSQIFVRCTKDYRHRLHSFEMYSMKWRLHVHHNGDNSDSIGFVVLSIELVDLPSITSIVSVRYTIFIQETNTRFTGKATFRANHMKSSWNSDRISTDTFNTLQKFTVRIDMELIDVYDNNYTITNRFLPKEHYDQLKQDKNGSLDIIRLEMNELEYIIDNLSKLNNDKYLNESVIELDTDCCDIDAMDEMQKWFCIEMKMSQYYQQFVEAGIEDLEMMRLLTENDLIQIGISNIADITKILIEITVFNLSHE